MLSNPLNHKEKQAIFAGSFDPLHEGHLSIINKALKIFDHLFVVVTINPDKSDASDIEARFLSVKEQLSDFKNVTVIKNSNKLTAELAKELNIKFLVRSARNNLDLNYEMSLAAGNHQLNNDLETILFFPDYELIEYSSTLERHKKFYK
ncbi:phosphopantetheine adenylyltransferase [Mesomycoplasma conjunctivae]|uniref:pantetheine-phosphate adenylyltransferase n=1 Tax=Mesomycoplasma conjunctivae TaxID=45361 RepID=UPI0005A2EB69|nr:pantetheine-phosphate adenylyltransferase [Mesomycoplasma conjunctivae]VEU65797.1 phosphopantetheine adenylyltransferase [Mesomycoplasma conjunctivae]